MCLLAQARNPFSRSWLWIPGSIASLAPRNDGDALQPQHHLVDDVLLEFRRAAEDGEGAAVEIFWDDRQHRLRDSGHFVQVVERPHRLDGQAVIADHLDAEPRNRL